MALTIAKGYIQDPNNPNGVIKDPGVGAMPGSVASINSQNTQAQPTINLNKPVDNTNYAGILAGAQQQALSLQQQINSVQPTDTKNPNPPIPGQTTGSPTTGGTDIKSYIDSLIGVQQPNAMQTYQQGYDQSGISGLQADVNAKAKITTEAQGRLNNISAQLSALNAEAQAIPIQLQQDSTGRGRTEAGLAPIQADALRANALKALPLQAQAAVIQAEVATAQGNQKLAQDLYTQAQDHFDKMFTLQMQDAQNQYEFKTNLINKVYEFADKQEQRQLEALKTKQQQDYETQKNTIAFNREKELANIKNAGISTGGVSPTTQSIIDNPSLFDDLTPTVKGQVISQLQANGYDTTNLGVKGLSDPAIKEIAQTQKALSDLNNLKTLIEGKSNLLGPITGVARFNPYSEARQLQADVDRVRQTVGKALEGGVLRKEDEDKYKKILATLSDTPETAIYKIDALISSINRDIENYKSLQQSSGRSLDVGASLQKKDNAKTLSEYQKLY